MLCRRLALLAAVAGCPAPRRPHPPAGAVTLVLDRQGGSLRGVAADARAAYSSITRSSSSAPAGAPLSSATTSNASTTTIEARAIAATSPAFQQVAPTWRADFTGSGGPIARVGALLAVTLGGIGDVAGLAMRGGPGAVVLGLDVATGAVRWKLAVDSSEWAIIAAIASAGDDTLVAGSFSGTLRAGSHVVSSGGKHDGFVARIARDGQPRWLVRMGGPGGDGVQGVAAHDERIAIAGTFSAGADLQGETLLPFDDRSLLADIFVAELDANGRRRWIASFGGKADDAVAGVAIDSRGRVAIAANAQQTIRREGKDLVTGGPSDGLVAWYGTDGTPGAAFLVGGLGLDGIHAITAVGDRIVIGGFFASSFDLGGSQLRATGDDAFVATLDGREVVDVLHLGGPGREELVALGAVPGGFCAGIVHDDSVMIIGAGPARDADAGTTLVIRPIR